MTRSWRDPKLLRKDELDVVRLQFPQGHKHIQNLGRLVKVTKNRQLKRYMLLSAVD